MPTQSIDLWLLEKLKGPEESAAYLKEHLIDDGEGLHKELLAHALANVAIAQGLGNETIAAIQKQMANVKRLRSSETESRDV